MITHTDVLSVNITRKLSKINAQNSSAMKQDQYFFIYVYISKFTMKKVRTRVENQNIARTFANSEPVKKAQG